jgi:prophage regulatory protein
VAQQLIMLRKKSLLAKVGCAESTLWMWISQGRFPAPVHLGDNNRVAVWPEHEVDAWLEEKIRRTRGTAAEAVEATPVAS